MLASGTAMFLLIPSPGNEKTLHPGKVLTSNSETFEAQFDDPISPQVGADVNMYGEVRGKFLQQTARVAEIRQEGDKTIFVFARAGEPVSAEQRQTYRVSSAATGIVARIGAEERCPVVDISPEGFGAILSHKCEVGAMVKILFRYWSEELTATVRIQTVHSRPDGKFRCGFLAPEKNSPTRKALERISMTLQYTELSRLAGAA